MIIILMLVLVMVVGAIPTEQKKIQGIILEAKQR